MLEHDLKCTASRQSYRHQIGRILLCKCQSSGKPRKLRPPDHGKGNDRILNTAAKHACYCKSKNKARKCQKQIGNTHQDSINDTAAPATDNSDHGSCNCDDRYQNKRCINTGRTSDQYSRKQISSITVCSHKMFCTGWFLRLKEILCIWIIRAQMSCQCCCDQQNNHQCTKEKKLSPNMIFTYFLFTDSHIFLCTIHALSPPSLTRGSR